MSCTNPVYLRNVNGVFHRTNNFDNEEIGNNVLAVPCGKCLQCAKSNSNEWTLRLLAESKLYNHNCFITLTYNDNNLPDDGLVRRDIQLFIKRLRKFVSPCKIRYFYSGEYGSRFGRPHFHIIVFNWCPDDLKYWHRTKKGSIEFISPQVQKLWKFGFSTIGMLNYNDIKYCAKYLQKFAFINSNNTNPYKVAPFVGMSLKPGIGYNLLDEADFENDKIYVDGHFSKIPRYILKLREQVTGEVAFDISQKRLRNMELFYESDLLNKNKLLFLEKKILS